MAESIVYNMDCMEYMKTLPDKYFDLAVVDPPYGDGSADGQNTNELGVHFHGRGRSKKYADMLKEGIDEPTYNRFGNPVSRFEKYKRDVVPPPEKSVERTGGQWAAKYGKKIIAWDIAPEKEYFDELFRISRNQIIWGGNYFALPPTRCFLVWRKLTISESFTMAMAEYAWTSFNANAKVFECAPQGQKGDERFHPTQKPIDLYRWIFKHYAKPGDKIIDTYLGSGSSRIAAYDCGLDFIGTEIDKFYFDKQEERFEKYTSQMSLFNDFQ